MLRVPPREAAERVPRAIQIDRPRDLRLKMAVDAAQPPIRGMRRRRGRGIRASPLSVSAQRVSVLSDWCNGADDFEMTLLQHNAATFTNARRRVPRWTEEKRLEGMLARDEGRAAEEGQRPPPPRHAGPTLAIEAMSVEDVCVPSRFKPGRPTAVRELDGRPGGPDRPRQNGAGGRPPPLRARRARVVLPARPRLAWGPGPLEALGLSSPSR